MTNPESSDLHQAFQSVDLFKFLKAEELETLEKIVRLRNYRSGQKIIQEFDRGMELFVIVSGSVKISTEDVEGREIIVSIAYPSDFFGEIALLDDDTRSATVTAIEPTTVLSIEKNDFLRFFCRLSGVCPPDAGRHGTTDQKNGREIDPYGVCRLLCQDCPDASDHL